jgi:hypothetical protein
VTLVDFLDKRLDELLFAALVVAVLWFWTKAD